MTFSGQWVGQSDLLAPFPACNREMGAVQAWGHLVEEGTHLEL